MRSDPVTAEAHWGALAGSDRSLFERLRRRLTRKTGCPDTAGDLLQDSCLRLAAAQRADVRDVESYLLCVARNIAIDRSRRAPGPGMIAIDDNLASPEPSVERVLLGREHLLRVMVVADRLPPKCRQVFLLRKIEGWEQHEIAAHLGISLNMVQKHLRKALTDIAVELGDLG